MADNQNSLPTSDSDPTVRWFWLVVGIHVLLYMTVCLATQPNLPLDMVEMLFWGQQWQLGYHKHPPLPAWITASAWAIGGRALLYLISQLTVVTTFWAVWQFAREKLSPWAALCSVFVLEGCYYCTFMVNDINNTIITRPFWALTILFLYRAITRQSRSTANRYWALTGVVIGLGMISKYYLGILVVALMMIPIASTRARRCLSTPGPWITTAVASLIFAPHLIWMWQNEFITLTYVLQRSGEASGTWSIANHVLAPLDFVVSQLPAVIPVIVLLTPLLFNRPAQTATENSREGDSNDSFFNLYLAFAFAGPILIYVVAATITGNTIRSMWGGPLFSFLGVALFAALRLPNDQQKINKIIRDSLCVGLVMVAALAGRNLLGPAFRDKVSRVHYPGEEIALKVNDLWNQHYSYPNEIVGGELFVAGCAGIYSPVEVDVYGSMSELASPWLNDATLQNRGGMIVWDATANLGEPPAGWLTRFDSVEQLETLEIPARAIVGSKSIRIGVAIVHPTSLELAKLRSPALPLVEKRAQLIDSSKQTR